MDTATVWSCILNSLYRGQILYGQPEANLNSQHSYIHISCSMMVQNKTKIRSQVICNSSASRLCLPSQCPSPQPIPATLHAEAVYLKVDFLCNSKFSSTRKLPSLDADSRVIHSFHHQVVHLDPVVAIPSLHPTGQRWNPPGDDQLLSQLCHREVCSGGFERCDGLPHVSFWMIELCRGQRATGLIVAAGDKDPLLPLEDSSMASVAPALFLHTRFLHPGERVIC